MQAFLDELRRSSAAVTVYIPLIDYGEDETIDFSHCLHRFVYDA
jgi:hypothetical protein